MKLSKFRELIDQIDDAQPEHSDPEVTVVVRECSLGSTPSSRVRNVVHGFDWNSWQVMIYTEDSLLKV